jgi:hypothetical protein
MRILRRQKSAYALAITMCFLGLAALLIPLWKMWPQISSAENPLSAFWWLIWRESLNLPGFEFELAYFVILGFVMLISGVIVFVLSRQWFYLPGKTVLFQCPFCKKQWRSHGDKALVHCPHCLQLVHPKIVEK